MNRKTKVLVITATFPSKADPTYGVFVKERIKALASLEGIDVRVIAPVPWFPPIKISENWHRWSQFPRRENIDGINVYRPRYVLPPKIGGYFHSDLMLRAVHQEARKIRRTFKFDVIDSHFVFPGGVAAVKIAKSFDVPVLLTGRGEDMLRFPNLPLVGKKIRWALANADYCIGVSKEISAAMVQNCASKSTTTVISNGIDCSKFFQQNKNECRNRLGLNNKSDIILSVGERIPRKGFSILIDAMPFVLEKRQNAQLIILGRRGRYGRDTTEHLHNKIRVLGLKDSVTLLPPCEHDQLRDWYGASDIFALLSSSEGCPNVILESLACGTPCVATNVGSIPDDLANPNFGRILKCREARQAGECISSALNTDWDRTRISGYMKERSWKHVAIRCQDLLNTAIRSRESSTP